jgi:hypothetical protein
MNNYKYISYTKGRQRLSTGGYAAVTEDASKNYKDSKKKYEDLVAQEEERIQANEKTTGVGSTVASAFGPIGKGIGAGLQAGSAIERGNQGTDGNLGSDVASSVLAPNMGRMFSQNQEYLEKDGFWKAAGKSLLNLSTSGIYGKYEERENLKDAKSEFDTATKKKEAYDKYWSNVQQSGYAKIAGAQQALKEGGAVKGPGTAKSDSIKGSLKEGSFVVPAENAKKAETIRKKYFGQAEKKAQLKGDVPVMLSNGEHVFTPEEAQYLLSKGVDLDSLAPKAEFNTNHMNEGGWAAAAQAAPYVMQGIQGISQNSQGNKLAAMNQRPTYNIPSSMNKAVGIAEGNMLAEMPGQSRAEANIGSGSAAALDAVREAGGGSASIMAAATQIHQNQSDAYSDLATKANLFKMQNQQNLVNTLQAFGDYQDQEWYLNKYNPYMERAAAARALKGSGQQNMNQAFAGLADTGAKYYDLNKK